MEWWQVAIVIIIILIIVLIGIFLSIKHLANSIVKANFDKRYNDNHTLKYFTVDDFENLKNEPIEFISNEGQKLRGFIYCSTLVEKPKALLVVSHGLGAGHLQYTTEINYFAQKGYLVFAFDNTACNLSDGEQIKGVTRGVIDLEYALKYIETDERLSDLPILLFGHSMGAFSVCNVTSVYDKNIKGVVALAPFKDEPTMLYEQVAAVTGSGVKMMLKMFKNIYKKRFDKYSELNTIDSLEKTTIPHLIISGDQDPIVNHYENFEVFKDLYEKKEGFEFIEVKDRFHRPNLSLDAAKYDQDTNIELTKINAEFKNKAPKERIDEFYKSLDYDLLVKMDYQVMESIINFYEKCLSKNEG